MYTCVFDAASFFSRYHQEISVAVLGHIHCWHHLRQTRRSQGCLLQVRENCHSLAPLFVIVRVRLTDNSIEWLRTELFSGALKNNRSLSELNLSCECMIEGHKWSNERFDFFFLFA